MTTASPMEARYSVRNVLQGKWSAIARRGAWMFLFIYSFMMLMIHFVQLRTVPTFSVHLGRNVGHDPQGWWSALAVSILLGFFVGAMVVVGLAFGVRVFRFEIYSDRLIVRRPPFPSVTIALGDILEVDIVRVPGWPRLRSFWDDIRSQAKFQFGTPRWIHLGFSQFFHETGAFLVVKLKPTRWVRAYILDVDHAEALQRALDDAIADFHVDHR